MVGGMLGQVNESDGIGVIRVVAEKSPSRSLRGSERKGLLTTVDENFLTCPGVGSVSKSLTIRERQAGGKDRDLIMS